MTQRILPSTLLVALLVGCATYDPPRNIDTPYTFPNRSVDMGPKQTTPPTTRVFISNRSIKLGIDPNLGGAITYLSELNQPNLVNNYDYGRQIQTSLYSGPIPYEPNGQKPHPQWERLGWNPLQVGDYNGTPAQSIEWRKIDSTHLYVRSNAIQWPLINVPGQCVMEHWYEIVGNTVKVRSRTTIQRIDTTFYNPTYQETPATILNGPWHRFVYYAGSRPFSNDGLSVQAETINQPLHYIVPECWGAMVDQNNRGIGLYRPNIFQFATNYSGIRGQGGEFDFSAGYMTGLPVDQLDYNGVYEYEYTLILGSIDEIRRYVYSQPRPRSVPNFVFNDSRNGWSYYNTRDQGWPIRNTMNVRWEGTLPERFRAASPFTFFAGDDAPKLYVQAAFSTNATTAHLIWTRQGDNDFRHRPNQELDFPIIGDGQMRVYEIDMSRVSAWQGNITRIAIEPTTYENLQRGGLMRLRSVTATRP